MSAVPLGLIGVLTFGSGILSALFLNDTIALILTPIVVGLTVSLKLNPVPYLLALAGAANIGSVATLSGNPQNILIGSFSGISYLDFAKALTPLAIVGLLVQVGLLWWLYPEVRSMQPILEPQPLRYRVFQPLLTKSLLDYGGTADRVSGWRSPRRSHADRRWSAVNHPSSQARSGLAAGGLGFTADVFWSVCAHRGCPETRFPRLV